MQTDLNIRVAYKSKMRILIILGHPDPKSFNHAIASSVYDTLRNDGHQVTLHDLYAEAFDPLLPVQEIHERGTIPAVIQKHCEDLRSADGIVIVHPNWWGQPPAILKGWIDRVFRPGVAYRFEEGDSGEGIPIGLLKAKAVVVLNTSNTPDATRAKSLRRSSGRIVEALHFRSLRCALFPSSDVQRNCDEHATAKTGMARGIKGAVPESLSTRAPQ